MKLRPILSAALFLNAVNATPAWSQDPFPTSIHRAPAIADTQAKSAVLRELPGGFLLETPAHWTVADEPVLQKVTKEAQVAGVPSEELANLRVSTKYMSVNAGAHVAVTIRPRQLENLEKLSASDLTVIGDLQSGKVERELKSVGSKLVTPIKARLIHHEIGIALSLRAESESGEGKRHVMEQRYIPVGTHEIVLESMWPAKDDVAEREITGIQKSLRLNK